jgi:hypothetical protein
LGKTPRGRLRRCDAADFFQGGVRMGLSLNLRPEPGAASATNKHRNCSKPRTPKTTTSSERPDWNAHHEPCLLRRQILRLVRGDPGTSVRYGRESGGLAPSGKRLWRTFPSRLLRCGVQTWEPRTGSRAAACVGGAHSCGFVPDGRGRPGRDGGDRICPRPWTWILEADCPMVRGGQLRDVRGPNGGEKPFILSRCGVGRAEGAKRDGSRIGVGRGVDSREAPGPRIRATIPSRRPARKPSAQ